MGHGRWAKVLRFLITVSFILWMLDYLVLEVC